MAHLYEARGITKRYGHVKALQGADFALDAGEVVALIGDNGAGKSTLVKVLSGVTQPDEGEILLRGTAIHLSSPSEARRLGIETVYQDLALAPELGPAENVYVGRELLKAGMLGRLGVLDKKLMRRNAANAFISLGTDVKDLDAPVAALSGGQRQSVAHPPLRDVGERDRIHGRADGRPGGSADHERASTHPSGRRHGCRRCAHQPQHARGSGGGRPHRGAPPRSPGRTDQGIGDERR